jgi:adenosylcobinamide kinase/adenosylcobinamide-phosphate guanylyltransferase
MPLVFVTRLARERDGDVVYVATGRVDPADAEWMARLAHHAAQRPAAWRVVETSRADGPTLEAVVRGAEPGATLLVDSLGTWLAELMSRRFASFGERGASDADALEAELGASVDALLASTAYAIVVGEECGWGLVPDYPSGRAFRDVLGRAQQRLAAGAAAAYLVVSGFAIDVRSVGTPV